MIKRLLAGYLLFAMAAPGYAAKTVHQLYLGEVKILNVGEINRIAVGNSKILSTSMLSNGQLLIIAEAEGDSNVHIWFNDGREEDFLILVKKVFSTLELKADEVRTLLSNVAGLSTTVIGERIVLKGLVDTGHAEAIETVKIAFPEVMDLSQKAALDRDTPDNKMVIMNIKITEFNKNYLEDLGIDWDTTIAGPTAAVAANALSNDEFRGTPGLAVPFAGDLTPRSGDSALGYFGIVSEITSRINFAVNSGNALILAEPRLAARSGGEASFLAGGEFPIELSTINGTTIEFKEFGIKLDVSPVVDRNNNIRAHVATEISAIDRSVAVGDVPGLLTRKASTDVSMRSGETLVMSGLLNQQASKDMSGIKFLSEIPILGALFKSQNFRDQRSELVIFVTPTVFDAQSDVNKQALETQRRGVEEAIKAIDEKSLDIIY